MTKTYIEISKKTKEKETLVSEVNGLQEILTKDKHKNEQYKDWE